MPFLAEELYQALLHPTGLEDPAGLEELSVHLQDWPVPDAGLISSDLEEQMTLVRQIVEKGHAARKEAGIKLRQPLKECKVYSAKHKVLQSSLSSLIFLLQDELNVKEIVFEKGENDEIKIELDTNLTSELIVEGRAREMIRQIQAARKKAGCQLDEWIETRIPALPEYKEVIEKFDEKIRAKTLSSELILDAEISQFQVTPS